MTMAGGAEGRSTNMACDECVRRSWLVARLAGHLERRRAERTAIRGVLALRDEELIAALGGGRRAVIAAEWDQITPADVLARWSLSGSRALCRCDPRYPAALNDLPDPPAVLHLLGDPGRADELLAGQDGQRGCVAVVGARRSSVEAVEVARDIGRGCAAAGLAVVSGMALGIDSAAHTGALDASGATIAVLACGPDRVYPPSRGRLHAEIAARGLVLSELPPGTTPYRWAFPARNRIIAALAGLTVVVEAAARSGSLITAEIALELGRGVGAVPGPVASWRSSGTNALLRDGAHVIRNARDVLDDLCGAGGARQASDQLELELSGLEPRLRETLIAVDRGADSLAAHASTPEAVAGALEALAELELLGLVTRLPGGRYAVTRRLSSAADDRCEVLTNLTHPGDRASR